MQKVDQQLDHARYVQDYGGRMYDIFIKGTKHVISYWTTDFKQVVVFQGDLNNEEEIEWILKRVS